MFNVLNFNPQSINSYSPWLGIAKVKKTTWQLVDKVFIKHEKGDLKGMFPDSCKKLKYVSYHEFMKKKTDTVYQELRSF